MDYVNIANWVLIRQSGLGLGLKMLPQDLLTE